MKLRFSHMIAALLVGAALGYVLMRLGAHLQAYGYGSNLALALDTFGPALAAHPLALPKPGPLALIGGLIGFLAPVLAVMYMVSQMGNFDLGKEYGDARWATPRERASVADKIHLWNNLMFTAGLWLVCTAYTPRQRLALRGRNHNVYVVGTSGTGKSYQYVKPAIMNAVGSLLANENVLQAPSECKDKEGDVHMRVVQSKAACTITSLVANTRRKKNIVDEGCDLLLTDPKGDNIEDTGNLLEAAAYNIKCLNLVDLHRSLHYNPLSYIKTRLVDAKAPENVVVMLSAEIDGRPMEPVRLRLGANCKNLPDRLGQLACEVRATSKMAKPESELSVDKMMRADVNYFMQRRGEVFKDAMERIEYRTSSMEFSVEYRNFDCRPHEVSVSLVLDRVLECTYCDEGEGVAFDDPANPKTIGWNLGVVEGRAKGVADAGIVPCMLDVSARVEHIRIPDGLDLAKTVDCLVMNLKEPGKPSGGDNQFWEDTERLMLMSLISYLFERFDPCHRTLGEVLRLLTMEEVSNEPGHLSALDVLMESWGTGKVYEAGQDAPAASSKRRQRARGRWVDTVEGAHDPADSLALHCYRAYKSGAAETLQSIVLSCHAALVKLFPKEIQELVSYDEMQLDTLGDAHQRQAIYAIVDDTDSTFNFLFALLIYQAVNLNCEKAYKKYGGKLPRHVHFILDEFANIGKIPNFERTIAVVRSRNISVSVILQSLTQLSSVYDKDADTIRDNCSTMLFLGGQSEKTLEGLSKLAGTETVDEITGSKQRGNISSSSDNRGRHGRDLVTISQLRELDIRHAIVMMSGLKPVRDKKIETWKHPLYRYLDPMSKREKGQPTCLYDAKFDILSYRARRERGGQRIATRYADVSGRAAR